MPRNRSDDELYEVLAKPDEWNALGYRLAQHILAAKGHVVDASLLDDLKQERMNELAKPEKSSKAWIVIGYVSVLLGGALGIVFGYLLFSSKKTLPNGEKAYTYQASDRRHGEYMFLIGLLVLAATIIWKIV